MRIPRVSHLVLLAALSLGAACSSQVSSTDDAKAAYLGLDPSIDKAIDLGFKGFNEAQGANIPPESAAGKKSGIMTVTGQVDQGASANKGMRLNVAMTAYSDVAGFTYDAGTATDGGSDGGADLPALTINLKGIPTGTLDGSLVGTFHMSGDLTGPVLLNLSFTGDLLADADAGAGGVVRKPGTTHITGTATSPKGTYAVNVTK